jgi:hypothetical protein
VPAAIPAVEDTNPDRGDDLTTEVILVMVGPVAVNVDIVVVEVLITPYERVKAW